LANVLILWINRRHQPSVPAICYLSRAFQLSQREEGRKALLERREQPALPNSLQHSPALDVAETFHLPSGCLLRARHLAEGPGKRDK
jgi:hypothetical protein